MLEEGGAEVRGGDQEYGRRHEHNPASYTQAQGALAMKMLSWEEPFTESIAGIRASEAGFIRRMARIRACNMALQFGGWRRASTCVALAVPHVLQ